MTKITDRNDYEALVKAAKILPVFERNIDESSMVLKSRGQGCFNCDHVVGPLSSLRRYSTIFFSETARVVSAVISLEDNYYTKNSSHPAWNIITNIEKPPFLWESSMSLEELNELYVRIWFDSSVMKYPKHINRRLFLTDHFLNGQFLNMYASTGSIPSTYVNPTLSFHEKGFTYGFDDLYIASSHVKATAIAMNIKARGEVSITPLIPDIKKEKRKKTWSDDTPAPTTFHTFIEDN
jgi:hypothetical protein